jgi:hypothetical protein
LLISKLPKDSELSLLGLKNNDLLIDTLIDKQKRNPNRITEKIDKINLSDPKTISDFKSYFASKLVPFYQADPKTQKSPADLALADLITPSPENKEEKDKEILEKEQIEIKQAKETVSKTIEAQTNLKSQFPELSEPDETAKNKIYEDF